VTGYLVCTNPNPPSLKVIRDLSAMPPSLLNAEIEEIFTQLYKTFEREDRLLCFETSVSRDIRIVPIRPDEKTEVKQPVFYPDRLMGFNVSSNPGLIYVLRSVFNETSDRSNYRILVSDCNVFLRAIKVKSMFSSSSSHLSLLSVIISVLVDVHLLNDYSFPPPFPLPPSALFSRHPCNKTFMCHYCFPLLLSAP
jgi:hypothetical protein